MSTSANSPSMIKAGDTKKFGLIRRKLDFSSSSSGSSNHNTSLNKSFVNLSLSSTPPVSSSTPSQTPSSSSTSTSSKSSSSKNSSRKKQTKAVPKKLVVADRFIADRSNFEMAHYLLQQGDDHGPPGTASKTALGDPPKTQRDGDGKKLESSYSRSLTENLLGVSNMKSPRVLNFAQKPRYPPDGYRDVLKVLYEESITSMTNIFTKSRVIANSPDRVLDAPKLINDFYLNIMDWSKLSMLAIALKNQVYLWTSQNDDITTIPCKLFHRISEVSSVAWVQDGVHVACGLDIGAIQIWDVNTIKLIRTLENGNRSMRIAAMSLNKDILTEGNRLGHISHHDLRMPSHQIACIEKAHDREICGMKWSSDGRFIASSANDQIVNVWDSTNLTNNAKPVCTFNQHKAAVKALCWLPSQHNILASGGGSLDKTIKIWNVSSGSLVRSTPTEGQVTGLVWNEDYKELLSSHGGDKCQVTCWKYPNMAKVGELTGHSGRILHLAQSPDKTSIVTAAADETLRFWRTHPPIKSNKNFRNTTTNLSLFQALR